MTQSELHTCSVLLPVAVRFSDSYQLVAVVGYCISLMLLLPLMLMMMLLLMGIIIKTSPGPDDWAQKRGDKNSITAALLHTPSVSREEPQRIHGPMCLCTLFRVQAFAFRVAGKSFGSRQASRAQNAGRHI